MKSKVLPVYRCSSCVRIVVLELFFQAAFFLTIFPVLIAALAYFDHDEKPKG